MELRNKKLTHDEFMTERHQVLQTRETGKDVENFEDGVKYQQSIPEKKRFSLALLKADQEGKTLSQPRAGVALMDEHIALLKTLQEECDLLPSTIDAYTRLNRYEEAAVGIQKSIEAGTSKLNGLPVVNHGVAACRRMTESLDKPIGFATVHRMRVCWQKSPWPVALPATKAAVSPTTSLTPNASPRKNLSATGSTATV